MHGKRPPSKPGRTPPKGVVVRQSSDIMAVEHVEVAKALRAIEWRQFTFGGHTVLGQHVVSEVAILVVDRSSARGIAGKIGDARIAIQLEELLVVGEAVTVGVVESRVGAEELHLERVADPVVVRVLIVLVAVDDVELELVVQRVPIRVRIARIDFAI